MADKILRCPYCGDKAPHGDERHLWLDAHMTGWFHRWWWTFKKKFR